MAIAHRLLRSQYRDMQHCHVLQPQLIERARAKAYGMPPAYGPVPESFQNGFLL